MALFKQGSGIDRLKKDLFGPFLTGNSRINSGISGENLEAIEVRSSKMAKSGRGRVFLWKVPTFRLLAENYT